MTTARRAPRKAPAPAQTPLHKGAPAPAGSGGHALDRHTSAAMSAQFGHDFSAIRIHADARAARSAQALGADAYALGGDIVFGAGQYQPGSPDTERLLAHELIHVTQQARFGPGDPGRLSRRGDASEREAEALTSQVMRKEEVQVRAAPGAAFARHEARERAADQVMDGTDAGESLAPSPHGPTPGPQGPTPGPHGPAPSTPVYSPAPTPGQAPEAEAMTPAERAASNREAGGDFSEKFFGSSAAVLDVIKETDHSEPKMGPGLGAGVEGVGQFINRLAKGQGVLGAAGGAATQSVTTGVMNMEAEVENEAGEMVPNRLFGMEVGTGAFKDAFGGGPLSGLKGFEGAANGAQWLGAGMQMLGAAKNMGKTPEERERDKYKIDLSDFGEYTSDLSYANPANLAKEGIKEGVMGLYNTGQALVGGPAEERSKRVADLDRDNMAGKNGSIVQGYSELADLGTSGLAGAMEGAHQGHGFFGTVGGFFKGGASAIGDEAEKLAPLSQQSALGKLGGWMGDKEYDAVEALGGLFGGHGDAPRQIPPSDDEIGLPKPTQDTGYRPGQLL